MTALTTFAADTLLRIRGGRTLIHTTSSRLPAFETENAGLIGWLCQFAKPRNAESAITSLQPTDRAAAAEVLEYLRRSGALVDAEAGQAAAPTDADQAVRTKSHLRLLARSFYDTACDLLSFGPHAEQSLRERTGSGVERRLMALLAAVDGLRSELTALRQPYVHRQLQALALDGDARELKLHIGCGKNPLSGWVNIDVFPAPLAMNVLWGLPFPAASARYVFVSHLLEHLFFPRDVKPFLTELRRVLAPAGVVRLVVPDIEQCIEAYVKNDKSFFGDRREAWPWWPSDPTRLEDFLAYAGAGAEPAYLFESHKYGYDFETLSRVLVEAGFIGVIRSRYMSSEHPALKVDEISTVASATYGGRYYSLFVEATNPG